MLLARLSSANCFQTFLWASFRRGFLLGRRPCKRTCCCVWSEHWQADLPLLQPLKQCWQHSWFCFLKPASATDAQHKDSISLMTLARPVPSETRLEKPLYDPGHCTVTQFQAVTELLIATIVILQSSESSLPWGAMLNIQWSVWENCLLSFKAGKTWTWHAALHG